MKSRGWWLRVVAPPAAVGAVIAGVSIGLPASAAPSLPAKTAQQLLAMVAAANVDGVSGTVTEKAALGLPSLPSTGDSGPSGLTGLLTGTHSLRVWDGGPRQLRLQVLDPLDETEVVVNGTDAWTYTFSTNKATHIALPPPKRDAATQSPPAAGLTPEQLAAQIVDSVTPTTQLTVTGTASVANRDAYTLTITPRTSDTTIGRVAIDVDSTTGVPLRVRIFAQGATSPALSVGFSDVSFGRIPASRFAFTPPPGAQVSTATAPMPAAPRPDTASPHPLAPGDATTSQPYTVGTGWSTVVVLPHNPLSAAGPDGRRESATRTFADALAKAGRPVKGGTLLSTALLNVLVADDGRMLIGAVPASTLETALTAPAPAK